MRRLSMSQIAKSLLPVLVLLSGACSAAEEAGTSTVSPSTGSDSEQAAAEVIVPEQKAASAAIKAAISERLIKSRPDLIVAAVSETPIQGLYEVKLDMGPTLFASADGEHFIPGDLYRSEVGRLVNLSEKAREGQRQAELASVDEKDMIVFSPKDKRASITVFTDIDCGFCQKLHLEVPELNRMGIEVRYLAYPRAGVGSPGFNKLVSAWCADDQQVAMTKLKNREHVPMKSCANPVARQYQLGMDLGVTGTPAIILENGQLLPGYMPAAALAQSMGLAAR